MSFCDQPRRSSAVFTAVPRALAPSPAQFTSSVIGFLPFSCGLSTTARQRSGVLMPRPIRIGDRPPARLPATDVAGFYGRASFFADANAGGRARGHALSSSVCLRPRTTSRRLRSAPSLGSRKPPKARGSDRARGPAPATVPRRFACERRPCRRRVW